MIRNSPAEKYIEYLVSHPEGYSDDDIVGIMQLKQLDFIGPQYFARLRKEIRIPSPFYPENKVHKPSSRFLAAHRIYYLHHPDEAMDLAFRILKEPRAKEMLETMLITRDSERLCARRLSSLIPSVTSKAVERYKFFFFNIDAVDSYELQALIRLRTEYVPLKTDGYEDQVRTALRKAGHQDPRRAMAAHPLPQVAGMMNQMRMGLMPSRADLARMVELAQHASIARTFNTVMTQYGPHAAAEARDWTLTTKMLGEVAADIGSPDAGLQRDLQALALKTDSSEVPHISQLTGGDHTVDLQPMEVVVEGEGVQNE